MYNYDQMRDLEQLVAVGDRLPAESVYSLDYQRSPETGEVFTVYMSNTSEPTPEQFSVHCDISTTNDNTYGNVNVLSQQERANYGSVALRFEIESDEIEACFLVVPGKDPLHWHVPKRAEGTGFDKITGLETYKYTRPLRKHTVIALARLAAYYARKDSTFTPAE